MNKEAVVSRILSGAIDCHCHSGPGPFPRPRDSIDTARQCSAYGMRAIVLKNHHGITSDRATLVDRVVADFSVYGGIVLNGYVGGINPHAVEIAIRLGGKIVWMPTQWAQHHLDIFGAPDYAKLGRMKQTASVAALPVKGISILDESGQLTPETKQVLDLVKIAGVALGTSHLSKDEIKVLVGEANKMGIDKKVIITHVLHSDFYDWSIEEQKELVKKGAIVEHIAAMCLFEGSSLYITPKRMAELIDGVGYRNAILSSDCGSPATPAPAEGMRLGIGALLDAGMEEYPLHYMLKENPIRLLGLM